MLAALSTEYFLVNRNLTEVNKCQRIWFLVFFF